MKHIVNMALITLLFSATPCLALDIWHSNTVWAGQGMCSYSFTLDAQGSDAGIEKLTIAVVLLDNSGKAIDPLPLAASLDETLGDSTATRYGQFFIEGDCEAKAFRISKATSVIAGKQVDLLKEKEVIPRKFEPLEIFVEPQTSGAP